MDKGQPKDNSFFLHEFAEKDIADIVAAEMPQWKIMCDSLEVDKLTFYPDAFRCSVKDLLVMALAIKYATACKGKAMVIKPKLDEYLPL
jgi:hypothetical protein